MGKKAVFKLFYFISIIITLIVAGITIIGAISAFFSPVSSVFMAFLSLFLPILLVINFLLFIYWAIRRRYWIWIPLIAIVANFNFLTAIYQNPFRQKHSGEKENTFKIASYNVALFGKEQSGYSCKRIAEFMQSEKADILCLQEFGEYGKFTIDSINTVFKDWPYSVIPKAEGENILQIAIYSKYPIIDSKLIIFQETHNCSMWCDIQVNDATIRVFNNHLQTTNITQSRKNYERNIQNSNLDVETQFIYNTGDLVLQNERKRAEQSDIMHKFINESPYPVLACGDFNTLPSTYIYRKMKKDLNDGFKTCGHGYGYTYRYFKRTLRIDYIFHSPTFQGYDYYSPDFDLSSDHNPVIMELTL